VDIKDAYTEVFLKAADQDLNKEQILDLRSQWWWNVRNKKDGGLRLTDRAMIFIQEHAAIKTYKIDFPTDFSVTPQVLLWLDQFIESPYFIDKKSITVLREKSAFELYLFSGDIRKMGYSKAMSKRLNQDLPQK
jgi:hypothetical protein